LQPAAVTRVTSVQSVRGSTPMSATGGAVAGVLAAAAAGGGVEG
jgi:hypothetical protein